MSIYRLNCPTSGIRINNRDPRLVVIPKGALITVADSLIDNGKLVDCLWDGAHIQLLTTDILERGAKAAAVGR